MTQKLQTRKFKSDNTYRRIQTEKYKLEHTSRKNAQTENTNREIKI